MSTDQAVISNIEATGTPDINSDTDTYFILTSLTSGSSTIVTATSRLQLLFTAHKIPFVAIDVAIDLKAKRIWTLRADGKKLPVVVRNGAVIGNIEDLEDWNEYGELKQNLGIKEAQISRTPSIASIASAASKKPSAHPLPTTDAVPPATTPAGYMPTALVQAAAQAAALATEKKKSGVFSSSASMRSVKSMASKEVTSSHLRESIVQEPTSESTISVPCLETEHLQEAEKAATSAEAAVVNSAADVLSVTETKEVVSIASHGETVTSTSAKDKAPTKGKTTTGKPLASRASSVKSVNSVRSAKAPSIKTPSVRTPSIKAPSTKSAARSEKTTSQASALEKSKSTTARAHVTERLARPTGRAPPSENSPVSRSTSRASTIRGEARTTVPRVPSTTGTSPMTEKSLKAPSISARSVKSTSSASTSKPTPTKEVKKKEKKGKSKLDKLEREEGERFCGMACIIS